MFWGDVATGLVRNIFTSFARGLLGQENASKSILGGLGGTTTVTTNSHSLLFLLLFSSFSSCSPPSPPLAIQCIFLIKGKRETVVQLIVYMHTLYLPSSLLPPPPAPAPIPLSFFLCSMPPAHSGSLGLSSELWLFFWLARAAFRGTFVSIVFSHVPQYTW